MGCLESKEEQRPAQPARRGYQPPPPPSAEELARREHEKQEEVRWMAEAKRVGPPEPPKAILKDNPSESDYKAFMKVKYEHEAWENQMLLLARKLRAQAAQ
eukprot:m51a1_g6689 hypothetical protein (101) ;mRNA; r:59270-59851